MTKHMTEIGYDNKKLPLGKLAAATIEEGQRVLSQLSDVISGKAKGSVGSLSDHFYSVIPHDFGFQKMSAFVIRTEEDVKRKREMLESLAEVSFAIRLLADLSPASDPVTASYGRLGCLIERLEPDDTVADMIKRCVTTTAGCTGGHTHYTLEVEDVFAARRGGEADRFRGGGGGRLGNHRLLWHGSRLTNWVGILSKGLLIAPPEAPSTGYMFGKGVYFADVVTKSANYCSVSPDRRTAILALCEVALGESNDLLAADYNAKDKLLFKTSTKGVGRWAPTKWERLPDGSCELPVGPLQATERAGLCLQYNEYIVYNLDQVKLRYLVRVRFNFK